MYRANWQPLFIDHVTFQKHGLVEARHTLLGGVGALNINDQKHKDCVVTNGGVHEMEPSVSDMEMAPTDQAELHYIMTSSLLMEFEWWPECLTTLACSLWWMLTCALRKIRYLLLHAKSITYMSARPKGSEFMARPHQKRNKEVNSTTSTFNRSSFWFCLLCQTRYSCYIHHRSNQI